MHVEKRSRPHRAPAARRSDRRAAASSQPAALHVLSSTMPELNDSQLEGRYAMLLEKLDGEKRAHLVKNMAESDAALKRMSEEQADAMDDLEQV